MPASSSCFEIFLTSVVRMTPAELMPRIPFIVAVMAEHSMPSTNTKFTGFHKFKKKIKSMVEDGDQRSQWMGVCLLLLCFAKEHV